MGTFARRAVVKRPRALLFGLMQDYSRRLEWDPFLSEARLVGAEAAGLGVRAWCVDHAGRGMETEYVSFQPPERVAVKMTRGPWMFRAFAGSWVYEEVGPDETSVVFRYHVESSIPGTSGLLTRVFARRMDARMAGMVAALERAAG